MEEYTFQGESYTREELEQIALEKGYSFEELLQKNPSIELAGKQTGVPSQAANVTPENVAAVTGLQSGTSLSESQRLTAPIAQPVQEKSNINQLLQQAYGQEDGMALDQQAKFLYDQKADPVDIQFNKVLNKKI